MSATTRLLVGNSFPPSLVRRPLRITPRTSEEWRQALAAVDGIASYWGHANTLAAASEWAGIDLTPRTPRPALTLSVAGHPTLDGQSYNRCWVLSPNYAPGFRPKEGEIVPANAILSWQALEIVWE